MRHDPLEFLSFVTRNFRPIEAMCRERMRFERDDQIVAFLQRFESDDRSATRLIGRMREIGVLRELAGHWSPPPFLVDFIEKLAERHSLASPKVIQGWIASILDLVAKLTVIIDGSESSYDPATIERASEVIHKIADELHAIVHTVEENCERIGYEVAQYRSLEDSHQMRSRLQRLVELQDEYLDPVIRILEVNGELFAATNQVQQCCVRLQIHIGRLTSHIAEDAQRLEREIVWLRRVTIRRAEEARRELAPLIEAAARESKIAVGVHRALSQIRQRNWSWLDLTNSLAVTDERDSVFFSDQAIESFLRIATHASDSVPPRIPAESPSVLPSPTTVGDLLGALALRERVDDLLDWLLDREPEMSMDQVMSLFHVLTEPNETMSPVGTRRVYCRGELSVRADCWAWDRHSPPLSAGDHT